MRNSATLALLGALCAQGRPADEMSAPAISVLVYDYAGDSAVTSPLPSLAGARGEVSAKHGRGMARASGSADILNAGLREAQRILKSGGVEVGWVHCPIDPELLALDRRCHNTAGPLTLVLDILGHGFTRRQTEPGAAGFAVPPADGGFGTYAGVFQDVVIHLGASMKEAAALGCVIAHEVGHLLLGTGQHSAGGIMKADWRPPQIRLASQGQLRFNRAERLRMLNNLRRRMLAADAQGARVTAFAPQSAPVR